MAAFDLLGVLQQARVGMASTDWKLFPLQRRAVIMNLISIWILGFFAIGVAMYLFVSGSAYVPRFLPDSFFSDTGIAVTSLIESLFFLAVGIWLLVVGIRLFGPLTNSRGYFFLVTPDGFAGVKGEKVVGRPFADVMGLQQKNGYLGAGTDCEAALRRHADAEGWPELRVNVRSHRRAPHTPECLESGLWLEGRDHRRADR